MNLVITGANRGIGLEFVQQYLQQGDRVWALYRADAGGLGAIDSDRLTPLVWDVCGSPPADTFKSLPDRIDLLINNAGIYGPDEGAGQSLTRVRAEDMQRVFAVNCIGALQVTQTLLERVVRARGRIANISSKMGSTADNRSGGSYAYRASKAALVIVSKSMAVDLAPKGVRVITLHPGWVRTDMTGHTGEIDVQTSVAGMRAVIEDIDRYPPGAFIGWDREEIPY